MPHSVLPTGCKGFQGSGDQCERLVRSGSSESDSRDQPCLRTRQAHMSDFFHNWLAWLDFFEQKPEHTVRAYSQGVRRAVLFGDLEPTEFGPESFGQATLTDTVVDMRTIGGVSKATLNQTLAALKSFYDFCKSEKIPDVPDVGQIRKLARIPAESSDPEYYRPEDIRELYTEAIRPSTTTGQVRWPCRDLAMCSFLAVLTLMVMSSAGSQAQSDDLSALNRQVGQLYRAGKYTQAIVVARHVLALAEKKFGRDHRHVAHQLVRGRRGDAVHQPVRHVRRRRRPDRGRQRH